MRQFGMMIALVLGFCGMAEAKLGVAFIHGKASPLHEDPVIARSYWGEDFLAVATKHYSVPYFVAHYDGTKFMADAAKDVAKQLTQFLQQNQITELVINTHSFGGVVMRYMLSNSEQDRHFAEVLSTTKWVNTIAAPQKGSKTADLVDIFANSSLTAWLIEMLGQNNPATHNLRTADMAYYNQHVLHGTVGQASLPVPFYHISGTDSWNDFSNTFHLEDLGLAMIGLMSGFTSPHDGVVETDSAQAVGEKWFETKANHHHNRRNDYEPIAQKLAADLG